MYVVKRSKHNPILSPDDNHYWEEASSFNLCALKHGDEIYGLYRAISANDVLRDQKQISTIGICDSTDGLHFQNRRLFISPTEEWEQFGCEDPRTTFFEGVFYTFYTALSKYPFGPDGIKVAVALSSDLKSITEKHLITPFNAKAMTLFPERINGKITVIFSAYTDSPPTKMVIAQVDRMEELWSADFWQTWNEKINNYTLDLRRTPHDHIEVGAPPLKTEYGWLLIYSHIQNYFPSSENLDKIFGIEAILFDLNDPQKIIGRTSGPMLVPEESYELFGHVNDVVFPSGALIEKDNLIIYYGAADTTVCSARVNFKDFITSIYEGTKDERNFKRAKENPIIIPRPGFSWEAQGTFNPAAILLDNKTHILYRAFSSDNTSYIGYAMSENGINIVERLNDPIYAPREDFESKKTDNGYSGCEDPRLTQIGDRIYMCYTAYDGVNSPRVAVTSISLKDFLAHNWNWQKPVLITPEGVDDKDACIFPQKFSDNYFVLHRINNEVCGDFLDVLDFEKNKINKCIRVLGARRNAWDSAKVGIAGPPIETEHGWLLFYHGVSKSHSTYRVGAILLDLKNPALVLSRITEPIFEPVEPYEKIGFINNVVFPCGTTVRDGIVYLYYGGADQVVGVATMKLKVIVDALVNGINLEY